ncbi:MAG TPA: TRAM domain-containing protein [Candidatus Omnitrophota bacterium]|nr:TRAM domain-containing protein [Candidatus Omnitrophota bacterium]
MLIDIVKIAYGGNGIGRLEGKVCFVENALPGETVEIEILNDKKNFIEARAIKIETPSPERETPPCPYYGSCGGCQYQHMSYAEELRWKEIQIRESLQKQLQLPDECFQPIVASSKPYHYRNHLTLHRTPNGALGFVNEDNESAVAIESCLIAKKELNEWLKTRKPESENQTKDYHPRITARIGAGEKVITSAEDTFFNIPLGNTRVRTHSRCFFQNNLEMTLKMAEKIYNLYESARPEQFWDLYAGVGTFTIMVNPRRALTLCVESHPSAVEALEMNLKNAGLAAEIAPEPVEDCIEDILEENRKGPILALLDPPRMGLDPIVTRALSSGKGPDIIAYISCHMGALGRDLRVLTERAYRIDSVQAFDMFPRTKHIETLVILKKTSS